jgi:HD-GYP domain-containing protein (c-di-GMP phosphodiesterase class II)
MSAKELRRVEVLRPVAQLKEMLPGIELHHECIDGRGYPYGHRGEEIPQMARIIAVADTFDAMTTNRPYQSAMEVDFALERIRQLTGTKFDPKVADALGFAIRAGKIRLNLALVEV